MGALKLPTVSARWSISAVFFLFGALVGAWIPHIPDVKAALRLDNSVLGLALLSSGIGAVCLMPATGTIIHRFGSKHVSVAAGLLACLLVPWLVVERSLIGLVLNLFVIGLCYGCLDVAMNAHSVVVQSRHDRPILSAVHGFWSIGGFAGSAGAAAADRLGVPAFVHLWINSAALILLLAWSSQFLLPSDVDKDAEGAKFVVPHGIFLLLGILCLFAFVAEGGFLDWTAVYLRSSLGTSAEVGAIGAAAVTFCASAGRFVGDYIVAKLGYLKVLVSSGLITAAGIFAGVNFTSPLGAIACFGVASLGLANIVPILFLEAGTVEGYSAGAGLAAVTTCAYAGFLLGPPLLGRVADMRGLGFSLGLLGGLGLLTAALSPYAVSGGRLTGGRK